MKKMAETTAQSAQGDGQPQFKPLTIDQLLARPPLKYRIKGLLPETGLAAIYGPSGSGKSFLALSMAMALSDGLDWFGFRMMACPVTYCALEGAAGMASRINAYRKKYPFSGKQLHFITESINIRHQADVDALAQAILANGSGGGVLVIDTLNRASPGADENASRDMSEIISNVTRLQAMIGGLVILIHHTGKDETKGLRGHSSLHAALDVAIEVKRIGKSDKRVWQVSKSKDGSEGEPHPFMLEIVTIDIDEDGEEIESCVVVSGTTKVGATAHKESTIPGSKNQRIIYMILREKLSKPPSEGGSTFPAFVPANQAAIHYDEAVRLTKDLMDCDDKHKTERAKAAIDGLVRRGTLTEKEAWLWFP